MKQTEACYYEHKGIQTRIMAVADGVVRITHTRRPEFLQLVSPVVTYSQMGEGILKETEDKLDFVVGKVTVRVDKKKGFFAFYNAKGDCLLREPERWPHFLEEKPVYLYSYTKHSPVVAHQGVDGIRASATADEIYQDRIAYEGRQQFVFDEEEGLYGLGSHEEGYGNLRGHGQMLYQHNMKAVVPVLVSTKGYGLLFDMGGMMSFHDDLEGSYLWVDCADELNWYFFYGDGSYHTLMKQYRLLTGETPMLPKYALGYIQSKEHYTCASEILEVAKEYRRRQVPLDMIVMDWQSWPGDQWGRKKMDETRFPNPSGFTQTLHDHNIRFMLSIWPSMRGEGNTDREEMLEHGFMLGNQHYYNAFDPAARSLYWKQANDNLFSNGVDAWWCDCTEPFESDWHGVIKPEPFARARLNTDEAKRYIDPTNISLYSLYHSQGIYEGQRSVTDQKRVCNLTRSSYAGQHRYATVTWSGDVSAKWEVLRRHIPEGMNFCATGEAYWTTDIGAFFPNGNGSCWFCDGDFDRGMADLGYRELYVRWAQYAVFLPMMRSHGTGTPREIWRLGEEGQFFYEAMKKAIQLRYRLVPYLYTLMAQTQQDGVPMLRVPALVFPEDKNMRKIDDQMMLGDVMLIKPVTHPMYYLPNSVEIAPLKDEIMVYLPEGHLWYDWNTCECYEGGQSITVHAPMDQIPMFVRSGSILPLGNDVQSTVELAGAPLEVIIYPGEEGTFNLYDDAGDGYGYESGEHGAIPFAWNDATRTLTIGSCEGNYPQMSQNRTLYVHCVGTTVQKITYNGEMQTIQL